MAMDLVKYAVLLALALGVLATIVVGIVLVVRAVLRRNVAKP